MPVAESVEDLARFVVPRQPLKGTRSSPATLNLIARRPRATSWCRDMLLPLRILTRLRRRRDSAKHHFMRLHLWRSPTPATCPGPPRKERSNVRKSSLGGAGKSFSAVAEATPRLLAATPCTSEPACWRNEDGCNGASVVTANFPHAPEVDVSWQVAHQVQPADQCPSDVHLAASQGNSRRHFDIRPCH